MMKKVLFSLSILMLMGTIGTTVATAGPLKLRLSDDNGATWTTVTDGGGGDANGAVGVITFIGSVGTNWTLNVTTGVSNQSTGANSTSALMDLHSLNATSTGAGTLLIQLTDTLFPAFPQNGTLAGHIGGTLMADPGSTLEAWGYIKQGGADFDTTSPDASIYLGPFTPISFMGDAYATHGPLAAYTMTLVTSLTHTSAGLTSYDFLLVNQVPVPAGVVMLGTAAPFLGVGVWLRRRRAAKA